MIGREREGYCTEKVDIGLRSRHSTTPPTYEGRGSVKGQLVKDKEDFCGIRYRIKRNIRTERTLT